MSPANIPPTLRRRFIEATRSIQFATIEELVDQAQALGLFDDPEYQEHALLSQKKIFARAVMRSLTDEHGRKVFKSIAGDRPGRGRVRLWKQRDLFKPDDYVQVVSYHEQQARHHAHEAVVEANEAQQRYGLTIQLDFDWPDTDARSA